MLSKIRYYKAMLINQMKPSLLSQFFSQFALRIVLSFSLMVMGSAFASDIPAQTASVGDSAADVSETKTTLSQLNSPAPTIGIGQSVPQPSNYFSQIMLSLIFILLIIFAAAWLLRRYGRFPGVADGNLKVLGALSVGPRERILMLQVGKEQIVVGVTSSKISKLHELSEPVQMPEPKPVSGAFAQRLQEAMQGKLSTKHSENSEGDK